jgi:outer membrane protein assembly factor BamD
MIVPRSVRLCLALAGVLLGACRPSFVPGNYPTHDALYRASLRQFEAKRWENAVAGFERLTTELPARDTLFPPTLWHLGKAHQRNEEWLLAAQAFQRLAETFPTDTLADDAFYEAGASYARLWRKPVLDAAYGETALQTLQAMISVFPSSPLVPQAQRDIARLQDWFAQKDFEAGMHYFRRKGYDSAIIYFGDVVERYPDTPTARQALLRLAEAYRKINYREELAETCATLRGKYADDAKVREACAGVAAPAAAPVAADSAATPGTTP